MRTIRCLSSLVAGAALLLLASSAAAQPKTFTFVGKLTNNQGRNAQVPLAGNTTCGSLTALTGPQVFGMITRGVNTQPTQPITPFFDWKTDGKDLGCVKQNPGKTIMGYSSVGGAFTLPPQAFFQPYPQTRAPAHYAAGTDIPAAEVKYFPPAVQIATSISVTAPPTSRAHHVATQKNGTNTAPFRQFRAGAWSTQTGRAAPRFTWCPPPLGMLPGNPTGYTLCGNPPGTSPGTGGNTSTGNPSGTSAPIPAGNFDAWVKYNGSASGFGGTMTMVTHGLPGVGSLAILVGPLAINPFGGGESLPTGGGYANHHKITLPSGDIWMAPVFNTVYVGPVLGNQKIVTMVGAPGTFLGASMWAPGYIYFWGFPFTTMTVAVRAQNQANTKTTTLTARGWDCAGNMQGPSCSDTPTKSGVTNPQFSPPSAGGVVRNISLVAGSVGVARLDPPFGDQPIGNIDSMQIVLPEPSAAAQLFAAGVALLGIAAWRSRRAR